ncbi:MAG: glycosyl transferase [Saprospiraceae bacterium]|nr:glycosyl transferase [Saprospiraceae bacterium]
MLHFCTLFDSNYLSRGLVTYHSLMQSTQGACHLYVFAFDDLCFDTLTYLKLPNLTVISLAEFEDEELLHVKPTRTRGEYCWTCTSSTILYALEKFDLPHCTYIDADMFFYNNPQILLDEMPADAHVLITDHRYTPQYDKSRLAGRYCVQFVYFKNTKQGMETLNWWRERCLEWCFNRLEDGKFGDQKYLDDWATRFEGIHELLHIGGGIAPWNVQQYNFDLTEKILRGSINDSYSRLYVNDTFIEKYKTPDFTPVFFHFHGVKLYQNSAAIYAPKMYILTQNVRSIFYEPYIAAVLAQQEYLKTIDPIFEKTGLLPAQQFREDSRKGWGGFLKTNLLNKYFGLKLN